MAMLQVRADRRDLPPYGLHGGGAGAPSMNWLNAGRRENAAALANSP